MNFELKVKELSIETFLLIGKIYDKQLINNLINFVKNNKDEKLSYQTLVKAHFTGFKSLVQNTDFIKIDVEGYEAEVFKGAERVLREIKPRFIQIEFNWHQLFRNTALHYFSEQLPDYEVFQLLPNGWIARDPRSPLSNIFEFSNFVFVRG